MTKIVNQCRNNLHDDPLPPSYLGASDEATSRLANGWANLQCPDCRLYGWRRPQAQP